MTTNGAKLALAGVAISLGALALAGQANADPNDPVDPSLYVANPGAPVPAGVPVVEQGPPPPPGDAPGNFNPSLAVGRIPDDQAHYGSGSGPLGFIRDAWHQAQDPYNFGGTPPDEFPTSAPPAGAGPAPQLPPGYVSTNAPGSETQVAAADPNGPRPAPPPGYARMADGRLAPIPGYVDPAVAAAPPPYVPVHSPPPPPLLPEDSPPPPPFG